MVSKCRQLKIPTSSCRRKLVSSDSRISDRHWIPAFAGMTQGCVLSLYSNMPAVRAQGFSDTTVTEAGGRVSMIAPFFSVPLIDLGATVLG